MPIEAIPPTPPIRIRTIIDRPIAASKGRYVLYWMTANRRTRSNFALQHALWRAQSLGQPLLVLEALRVGYPHASDRLHGFVIQGMAANARRFEAAGIRYVPYVERRPGEGGGLLEALAERASLVVGDDFPCFFLPRMIAAAGERLRVRFEVVDANGIVPMAATPRAFPLARSYRSWFHREGYVHLDDRPRADPLRGWKGQPTRLPAGVGKRWREATAAELGAGLPTLLASLPIDHGVRPVALRGGEPAARARLRAFVADDLRAYGDGRNHPDNEVTSGLSPWLHFGHLGAHEVLAAVHGRAPWTEDALTPFLEQLLIWRELGFHYCWHEPDRYASFASLPDWARATLDAHRLDPRDPGYDLSQLEAAATHDPVWNAAQRQLVAEGRIHNYLRMLWGKNILAWSPTPEHAIEWMIELNDKYAVDGRDPNTYSGVFWVCGRFDRAWGPERPVFGKVRYMSSANTVRKLRLREYLDRWGP